jgi:hypothetical protein
VLTIVVETVTELLACNLTLILFAVRQLADISDDRCSFKPMMSHQVFGDR